MNTNNVIERLTSACQRHLGEGVAVSGVRRLTGGAASSTWKFDLALADGVVRPSILRMSQVQDTMTNGIDKLTEAKVQAAVAATGAPVPSVLFELDEADGLADGYVMECVEGESIPQKILGNDVYKVALERMQTQCAEVLARIHSTDVSMITTLPVLSALDQLESFEKVYRESAQALPVFEIAFRWLRSHAPLLPDQPTLVHGDYRTGNFLVLPQSGISSVLDWELAHRGDPMEDIGWLCVNSWRFGHRDFAVGGFAHRAPFYQAYADAAGTAVDPERVHYWEVFGVLKWGVICLHMTAAHLSGEQRSVERAAIGRRVSETEIDLVQLLKATDLKQRRTHHGG